MRRRATCTLRGLQPSCRRRQADGAQEVAQRATDRLHHLRVERVGRGEPAGGDALFGEPRRKPCRDRAAQHDIDERQHMQDAEDARVSTLRRMQQEKEHQQQLAMQQAQMSAQQAQIEAQQEALKRAQADAAAAQAALAALLVKGKMTPHTPWSRTRFAAQSSMTGTRANTAAGSPRVASTIRRSVSNVTGECSISTQRK